MHGKENICKQEGKNKNFSKKLSIWTMRNAESHSIV
jgi:hypothetical protein